MCEQVAEKFVAQTAVVAAVGSNPVVAFAVAEQADVVFEVFFLLFSLASLSVYRLSPLTKNEVMQIIFSNYNLSFICFHVQCTYLKYF